MIGPNTRKLMLRACARCQGDLLYDVTEEDFACLQCGRHTGVSAALAAEASVQVEAPVKVPALAA